MCVKYKSMIAFIVALGIVLMFLPWLVGCATTAFTNPSGEVDLEYNQQTGNIRYRSNKDMTIEYEKPDGTKLKIKSDANEAVKIRAEADKQNSENYGKLIDLIRIAP